MKKLILLITLFVGFFIQAQNYAIEQSGVITTYQDYPKTFTDSLGRTTLNYRTTSPTRKYDDGFRDIVKPTIDTQTQRQGAIYFDVANDVFTYFIDNLSLEEIEARAQQLLDADTAQRLIDKRKNEGIIQFDRLMSIIERRFNDGTLSGALAKGMIVYFDQNLACLYRGNWIVAKDNLVTAPTTTNADALAIYNAVKTRVDNYVTNNY